MATSTQFGQIVNEILGLCSQPELTPAQWTTATGHQRHAKRAVQRAFESMQNRLPDEHWQRTTTVKLFKPYEFLGGSGFGVETIVPGTPSAVQFGGSGTLNGPPTAYRALGAVGQTTCQDVMIQFKTTPTFSGATWDHAQWYRIAGFPTSTSLTLVEEHLVADLFISASGLAPNRIAGRMVQYRTALPADFRDVMDVHHPFGNEVDMHPMGVNNLVQQMVASGEIQTDLHPRYYAIGYDTLADGTTAAGPFLYWYPFPTDTRLYTLKYQRRQQELDHEAAAYTAVIDLPEDLVSELVFAAASLLKLAIPGEDQVGAARTFAGLAEGERRAAMDKTLTKSQTASIVPDMSTRAHFQAGRAANRPRIWVDGD